MVIDLCSGTAQVTDGIDARSRIGTDSVGYFSAASGDTTCSNWTSGGDGFAIVGHHDRIGLNSSRNMVSWNSAHGWSGYIADALPITGGAGLLCCFVAN